MPEGSIVREHSLDSSGRPQYMDITVRHKGADVKFYFQKYEGTYCETKLRAFKTDTYHYYELIQKGEQL